MFPENNFNSGRALPSTLKPNGFANRTAPEYWGRFQYRRIYSQWKRIWGSRLHAREKLAVSSVSPETLDLCHSDRKIFCPAEPCWAKCGLL
jgi:hypothetical protein